MKVLWFSTHTVEYNASSVSGYHAEGWIEALRSAIQEHTSIELGMTFFHQERTEKGEKEGITYYPVKPRDKTPLQKFFYYWGGYKKENYDVYLPDLLRIIQDFKPDIIQVFGIESPFACILGHTNVPVVIHMQGILNLCYNAFYPQGMNRYTFLYKSFSLNEWIMRNGYNFAADSMSVRCKQERKYFRKMKYMMGRTEWGRQISKILSPESQYYYSGEVLRDAFYRARTWNAPPRRKFIITSTISQTIYKGLDVILKAARLLTELTDLDFEWRVIGVRENSKYVNFFEKHCDVKSKNINVRYEGIYKADQIADCLLDSHVYIHPSYIDNSPNSLCEAQFIGLPVIGTYVGGIPSLIRHKETGILVPANAPYELCYWVQHFSSHPEAMCRLGNAAREEALVRHSKEKVVMDVCDTYDKIINDYHKAS